MSMRNFSQPSMSLVEPNAAGSGSNSLHARKKPTEIKYHEIEVYVYVSTKENCRVPEAFLGDLQLLLRGVYLLLDLLQLAQEIEVNWSRCRVDVWRDVAMRKL
jgi:hypothetical protein